MRAGGSVPQFCATVACQMSKGTPLIPHKRPPDAKWLPEHRVKERELTDEEKVQADSLLAWVSNGGYVNDWCEQNEFPRLRVAYWKSVAPRFREAYAKAREEWAETVIEESMRISDGDDPEAVQRDKLRVDTRLRVAAMLDPRFRKQQIEHSGNAQQSVTVVTGVPVRDGRAEEPPARQIEVETDDDESTGTGPRALTG